MLFWLNRKYVTTENFIRLEKMVGKNLRMVGRNHGFYLLFEIIILIYRQYTNVDNKENWHAMLSSGFD